MRNASLATRGERAATLHRRAVSPLSCTSPLSVAPSPLTLLRSPLPSPSSFVLSLVLFSLTLSIDARFLIRSLARSSAHLVRPSPRPPLHPHFRVRMYVSRGALRAFVRPTPISLLCYPPPSSSLSLSLSSSFTLSLSLSVSCSSLSVTSLSLSLSHDIPILSSPLWCRHSSRALPAFPFFLLLSFPVSFFLPHSLFSSVSIYLR